MRLDDMRVLVALAEAGSFTDAAERLALPKQTVSRRIQALEEDLGVRLAWRTTRTVRLTDEGRAFAARCAEVVRQADDAVDAVRRAGEHPRGTLRITTTRLLARTVLAPVIDRYLERFHEVSVDLLLTDRRVDLVEEGFDLAVRVGQLPDSTLVATRLGPATLRYVASPSYLAARGVPTTPAVLQDHACLGTPIEGGDRWPFLSADGRMVPVAVPLRLRADDVDLVHRAALAGRGVAMLPGVVCEDDVAAGRLMPLLADHTPDIGAVWLVTPGRRFLAPRVRAFLDLARAPDAPEVLPESAPEK